MLGSLRRTAFGRFAFLATLLFRRPAAGWAAALATPAVCAGLAAVIRGGLAKHFASLFPDAYASAPGISPDTVFWIFLPPLVRDILTHDPWAHAGAIGLLLGLTLGASLSIGGITALIVRRREKDIAPSRFTWRLWGPILGVTALAAAFLSWPPRHTRSDDNHPDVILVSIDTLRADAVGCYGRTPSPTPRLDRLAQTATLYRRTYAPAPWTIPSHGGLMTGLHNERHGAVTMDTRLPKTAVTLAERLAQEGYRTGAFVHSFMLSPRYGFGQGFQTYTMQPEVPSQEVATRAVDWLRGHPSPVFLFLHVFDPHWPYGAADEGLSARMRQVSTISSRPISKPEATRQAWRRRYEAEVRLADARGRTVVRRTRTQRPLERSLGHRRRRSRRGILGTRFPRPCDHALRGSAARALAG
jgi:hypothetical protein